MKYEAKAWKETEGPSLRNFDEKKQIDSVNGALALRPQIEAIIDEIWEKGFDGIYFAGIGGTYASGMQAEVYMRGNSSPPETGDLRKIRWSSIPPFPEIQRRWCSSWNVCAGSGQGSLRLSIRRVPC